MSIFRGCRRSGPLDITGMFPPYNLAVLKRIAVFSGEQITTAAYCAGDREEDCEQGQMQSLPASAKKPAAETRLVRERQKDNQCSAR